MLAYTFGLRHAFDADHIAAIDNTTRKLLQEKKRPLGVGFFFSLGHSTIVFALATGLALATHDGRREDPVASRTTAASIGAGVSGTFLLADRDPQPARADRHRAHLLRPAARRATTRSSSRQRLLDRGFMNRFFIGRLARRITQSWQMYPLGVLFGLGFDTATEVGAARARGRRRDASRAVPRGDLAAAALRGRDVPDGHRRRRVHDARLRLGVLEPGAEDLLQHHRHEPLGRRRARASARVELLQVLSVWPWLDGLDFGTLGYGIVGLFVLTWALSFAVWKVRRIEERWGAYARHSTGRVAAIASSWFAW